MSKLHRSAFVVAVLVPVLSGCGGSSDDQAVVELPPAGTSRISAVEYDQGSFSVVERYTYSETGLLHTIRTWRVLDGVQVGDPIKTITRTYDTHGRVLHITTSQPGVEGSLKATYGADGRLETTTRVATYDDSCCDYVNVMRFTWEGDRMTQVSKDGRSGNISYGADGKIASIDLPMGIDDDGPSFYTWRDDGQLLRQVTWTGETWRYGDLNYDEQGRLVELQISDSQYTDYSSVSRFRYDIRGRPVLIDVGGYRIQRVRWEDLLCQPVYEPQTPPTVDLGVTGTTSPVGATLVCSNQP